MCTRKILLNCCPPAYPDSPIASLSVLKSFLAVHDYQVNIKYWNIELYSIIQKFFPWEKIEGTTRFLLPFLYREALLNKREDDLKNIYQYYSNLSNRALNETEFIKKISEFDKYIECKVSEILKEDYLFIGFSYKLFQMFSAGAIANEIKRQNPNVVIVVGGSDDKKSAQAILRNYPAVNYVTWGEGENPLLRFAEFLSNDIKRHDLVNFVYWDNGKIVTSGTNRSFVDLNTLIPDYSDYFHDYSIGDSKLPIEGSRSCIWGKCRFCCFNAGYKYRLKDVTAIVNELESQITMYGVSTFHFTDNAINNLDNGRFVFLLDSLIELRSRFPSLSFHMAEVMSKGLSETIIKKLGLAGFSTIQIGYESLSDDLLSKIKKVNTVSSNILFVKWGLEYGIQIVGSNIIRNLIEETDNNIKESIQNLQYLRFFLGHNGFRHRLVLLSVNHLSKYYHILNKSGFIDWHCQDVLGYNPTNYLCHNDDLVLFGYVKDDYNNLWDEFRKEESKILNMHYFYKLSANTYDQSINYKEFAMGKEILNYTFTQYEWEILNFCNKEVKTLASLEKSFPNVDVWAIIKKMATKGLLYYSTCNNECVTIINTEKIEWNS